MRRCDCTGAQIACNDDACDVSGFNGKGSRITTTVTAGQPYAIVVDGHDSSQGNFTLTVTPP